MHHIASSWRPPRSSTRKPQRCVAQRPCGGADGNSGRSAGSLRSFPPHLRLAVAYRPRKGGAARAQSKMQSPRVGLLEAAEVTRRLDGDVGFEREPLLVDYDAAPGNGGILQVVTSNLSRGMRWGERNFDAPCPIVRDRHVVQSGYGHCQALASFQIQAARRF